MVRFVAAFGEPEGRAGNIAIAILDVIAGIVILSWPGPSLAILGMALLYGGITLLRGALWPFATLPAVLALVDRGVIAREERYLTERFGESYTDLHERAPLGLSGAPVPRRRAKCCVRAQRTIVHASAHRCNDLAACSHRR